MTNYQVPEGVLRAQVDGEEVLLNPSTGVYHLLNPSARDLVDGFQQGLSVDEAASEVAAHSGTDVDTVLNDCRPFIRQMLDRGLLEERS